jgi:hypothetical protein
MKPLLRKVKLSIHNDGSGSFSINGYFHEWANVTDYGEQCGKFPKKMGIIELENGIIEMHDPFKIQFVEEF